MVEETVKFILVAGLLVQMLPGKQDRGMAVRPGDALGADNECQRGAGVGGGLG